MVVLITQIAIYGMYIGKSIYLTVTYDIYTYA